MKKLVAAIFGIAAVSTASAKSFYICQGNGIEAGFEDNSASVDLEGFALTTRDASYAGSPAKLGGNNVRVHAKFQWAADARNSYTGIIYSDTARNFKFRITGGGARPQVFSLVCEGQSGH